MPVILMPEDYDTWLGASSSPEELRLLLKPFDAKLMEAYAVNRAVNSVKNDAPVCVEPVSDGQPSCSVPSGSMPKFGSAARLILGG